MNRLTPFVQRILILNVGLFILSAIFIQSFDLNDRLALHSIYSDKFQPYQFVTYMFVHAGFMHIFGNMLGLYFFGPMLEYYLGFKKFLILYFVCGIGAGFFYWGLNAYEVKEVRQDAIEYAQNPDPDSYTIFINKHYKMGYENAEVVKSMDAYIANPTNNELAAKTVEIVQYITAAQSNFSLVGASGAVFGILMAFALLFPNTELMLLFPPIPIKAKYLVGAYALFEIYSLYSNRPDDNVAHFAHITGMVFAFILIRYWTANRNSFY
ncbi:rhomboid family intramembrane serine protease [uncultured Cytophaga sp.]|uniref:rhomboid family intramembrane serine protease n=1 Tax=uncultured Cytophaga sp. TaxID=160238 RepID=UPI00260B8991|nr:rhomboid family intramembrane serine protease [uncultured Cytophaga sp.]